MIFEQQDNKLRCSHKSPKRKRKNNSIWLIMNNYRTGLCGTCVLIVIIKTWIKRIYNTCKMQSFDRDNCLSFLAFIQLSCSTMHSSVFKGSCHNINLLAVCMLHLFFHKHIFIRYSWTFFKTIRSHFDNEFKLHELIFILYSKQYNFNPTKFLM